MGDKKAKRAAISKSPVKAQPFDWKANDYPEYGTPGQAGRYAKDYLQFACPGCGRFAAIRCGHPKPRGEGASWDVVAGSLDDVATLTLAPSINCVGCCRWHGYLRNGVFVHV